MISTLKILNFEIFLLQRNCYLFCLISAGKRAVTVGYCNFSFFIPVPGRMGQKPVAFFAPEEEEQVIIILIKEH